LANPAGILTTGDTTFGPNTTFFVNLSSSAHPTPVAGSDYDQLQVNGNITLSGAKLDGLVNASTVQIGDSFTIIQTTGTITGKFAEATAPNGSFVVFIGGQKFNVVYNANSVVLTKIQASVTGLTVGASPFPVATLNQPVTVTATMAVEPGAGTIPTNGSGNTDTVTFTFTNTATSATITATVPVGANNVATFITPAGFLPAGNYTIAASFSGDNTNFTPSSGSLAGSLTVQQPLFQPNAVSGSPSPTVIATGAALGISPAPASPTFQDSLNLSATVAVELGTLDAANTYFTITQVSTGQTLRVPATITRTSPTTLALTAVWNGQFGGSVQQGDYTVAATFTDQFANAATTPSINTFVDTVAPTASTLVNPASPGSTFALIAPGTGLSVPGTVELTSTVGDAAFSGHPNGSLDHWTLTFATGVTTVRTFTGTGTSVDVTWDGANDAGQTVGDAVYTAT